MVGYSSGPGPVVSRIGARPSVYINQRFVAPPRFDECTIAAPSGVKTGLWLNTSGGSFQTRRASPPETGTVQISPVTPPILPSTASCEPSGDQASSPNLAYVSSASRTIRAPFPFASATATDGGTPDRCRTNAKFRPSGDHTGPRPPRTMGTTLPPKVGIVQISD